MFFACVCLIEDGVAIIGTEKLFETMDEAVQWGVSKCSKIFHVTEDSDEEIAAILENDGCYSPLNSDGSSVCVGMTE